MTESKRASLLQVQNLSIDYAFGKKRQLALDQITFEIRKAEVLGVLGESGSGKTTLALALLQLLPLSARILHGSILFGGSDMLQLKESELQRIRGARVSMIFQEPEIALNPVMRAIDQVAEVIAAHSDSSGGRCKEEARRILAEAGLDSRRLHSAFPHQLSGGERQRLVIAQALACRPELLIADEPTASLDSTLEAQWLSLMKSLRARFDMGILLITHTPAILAGLADRVIMLYRGQIIEEAGFEQLVHRPLHPYTQGLLRSMPPPVGASAREKRLTTIPGPSVPAFAACSGCHFEPRCSDRLPACARQEPAEIRIEEGRRVRCFKYGG